MTKNVGLLFTYTRSVPHSTDGNHFPDYRKATQHEG